MNNMKIEQNDTKREKNHKRTISNTQVQKTSLPPPPQPQSRGSPSFTSYSPFNGSVISESFELSNDTFSNFRNNSLYHNLPRIREYGLHSNDHHGDDTIDVLIEPTQNEKKTLEVSTSKTMETRESLKSNTNTTKSKESESTKQGKKRNSVLAAKNLVNDRFWAQNGKLPFLWLAMMMSTFIVMIFIYFTNLYRVLFGGLVPCLISLVILVPIYYFFKKYDKSLKLKSIAIEQHIEKEKVLKEEGSKLMLKNKGLIKDNDNLANNLLSRYNEIQRQRKKIKDLEAIILSKTNHLKNKEKNAVIKIEKKVEIKHN